MRDDLLDLLHALDGVPQDPRYHPEGDALYHSLQVFQHALVDTDDPALLAAALLHDVGKALRSGAHDVDGAELLDGLVAPRTVGLVRHHLDLLRAPAQTRRRHRATAFLRDLERLRRWDLAGRSPRASVCTPFEAVNRLLTAPGALAALAPDADALDLTDPHDEPEDLAR